MKHRIFHVARKTIKGAAIAIAATAALASCSDKWEPYVPGPGNQPDPDPDPQPAMEVPAVVDISIDIPSDPDLADVFTKDYYLDAYVTMSTALDGFALEEAPAGVKGRGNSTWQFDKKPYRLKFTKKQSLYGMGPAKSYVLLADYLDPTHMRNPIAFKAAELMGMPFTNHFAPARVSFNGLAKGAYLLTEKVGIGPESVNIDKQQGILLELDTHFDEPYQFISQVFALPVMVKDPDLAERAADLGTTPEALLDQIKTRFHAAEKDVLLWKAWETFDLDSFVDYMIVFNFTGNCEVDHPKSLYIYTSGPDDLLHFGPVWDFDWAYNYHFGNEVETPEVGIVSLPFLRYLIKNPGFMERYAERWQMFVDNVWPEIQIFIDCYADEIESLALEDGELWPSVPGIRDSSLDFRAKVEALKLWLRQRVAHISSAPDFGLFEQTTE